MTADDVHDILDKIAPEDLPKTVLVLKHGAAVTIDQLARRESDYLVIRGRENGTSDEGRGLFVPYEEVLYVKVDRVIRVEELKRMYGERVVVPDSPTDEKKKEKAEVATATTPTPSAPMDPAAIAKQNLLARIRAAKSAAGAGN
ncbi:MAG: hypothetical protein MUF18_17360 [Fimbriiglobus sp.]|nr:hypothetical protein [Fimbriiglobus sp.]